MARPKNSVSFMSVTLAELNRIFRPDAKIPVWASFVRYQEMKGIAIRATREQLDAMTSSAKVEIIDFNEPTIDMLNRQEEAEGTIVRRLVRKKR